MVLASLSRPSRLLGDVSRFSIIACLNGAVVCSMQHSSFVNSIGSVGLSVMFSQVCVMRGTGEDQHQALYGSIIHH